MSTQLENSWVLDAAQVARLLGADLERGLTAEEAARRLAEDGPNELRSAPPVSVWRKVLAQFRDPLIYLLLAAIAISLIAWLIEGRAGAPIDAIVIAIIVVVNAVLGYVQEAKAERAVAALATMTAVTSAVVRNGRLARVPSTELVRGDPRDCDRQRVRAFRQQLQYEFGALIECETRPGLEPAARVSEWFAD